TLIRNRLTVALAERGGDLPDVVALVAVLGKCRRAPQQLQVPGPDRLAQHAHLTPRVVEVILAGSLVTHCAEKPGHAVAEDPLPAVTERQRPRRVGADELHHRAPPAALGLGSEALPLTEDPRKPLTAVRWREEHI